MALRMWQSAACQQPLQSLLAQWQQPITTSCLLQADAAPQAANTSEQAESPIEATRTSTNASQAEHNCAMHQLRQEWKLRFQRRAESMRQQQTAQQAKQEHEQARSRERKAVRRSLKQQIAAEQQRLHSERLAAETAAAAEWRQAQDTVYAALQYQRRAQLLEESRHWITREALDARIEEALDGPLKLWSEVNTLDDSILAPPDSPQAVADSGHQQQRQRQQEEEGDLDEGLMVNIINDTVGLPYYKLKGANLKQAQMLKELGAAELT